MTFGGFLGVMGHNWFNGGVILLGSLFTADQQWLWLKWVVILLGDFVCERLYSRHVNVKYLRGRYIFG